VIDYLRCPACYGCVSLTSQQVHCSSKTCSASYPIVDGIPILIDGARSIFSVEDFLARRTTTLATGKPNVVKSLLRSLLGDQGFDRMKRVKRAVMPSIDKNICSTENYIELARRMTELNPAPLVLVLGGGVLGQGIEALLRNTNIRLVESDVSFGPRTSIILDAHDIPFQDGAFDAVIAQAVLEHVADPYRCVDEIHRVLKKDGLVYAETPFMQQVHAGKYDFTRFTRLGHRRLFRRFDELESGIVCGPGMALAWSYQYFLTSLVEAPALRSVARTFARFTAFYLKYFDSFLARKRGADDAASGFYLLGRRSELTLSDRDLIKQYRGLEPQ
jgi:SAM-dependent methyltransferase/uncharacterized protein YbaR (Trm112 family)